MTSFPEGGVAAIFGARGGIGRALAARLDDNPRFVAVLRFSRSDQQTFDITDETSIARAAEALRNAGDVRLAIDATGFLWDADRTPEKSLRELDAAALQHSFAVNATGPALLMKHVLPLLPRRGKAVFASLSARVGGIGDNRLGGWYGYRASKAALNQFVRTAAIETARRRPDAICVALHPGTVSTRLSEPFAKDGLDVRPPETAAADILAVIDELRPEHSGGLFDQTGAPIPW